MSLHSVCFIILICVISCVLSSEGDRSPFHQNCVKKCLSNSCNSDEYTFKSPAWEELSIWSQLLWNCRDECRYKCMWRTVQAFQERGYQIPKFHGKWPFVRLYGVQEPASALASLLNLFSHLYMLSELHHHFPKSTPLVVFWKAFAGVCINAWLWSTVFHTRDTPVTEFMDYACALSMVMALFIAALVRVFYKRPLVLLGALASPLVYYYQHLHYLRADLVDYDYNMLVNLVFGVVGSLVWVSWAALQLWRGRAHAWRAAAFPLLTGAALSLELLDFPPQYGSWDAHALWHLATAPLPLIFYRFVVDDLYFLQLTKRNEWTD